MRTYNGYEACSVSNIPQKKLEKAFKTGKLSLSADELSGSGRKMLFHPANAKLIRSAQAKNKGITGLGLSAGEIMNDLDWHSHMGGSMNGGSLWSWLKTAGKATYNFAKQNWPAIKPIISQGIDQLLPSVAAASGQFAPAVVASRALLQNLTGVGLKEQRLANLAKARAAKSNKKINIMGASGSFRIN